MIVTIDALELAVRALAFFNTVALTWLGLTVLLNADRRKLGTWLTGGGLLFGGLCSIGHGIVAGRADWGTAESAVAWWRLSWLPFAGAAYLWSVVVVWYSGRLRGRWECLGVTVLSVAGLVVFVMLLSLVGVLDTFVSARAAIGIYALFATASIVAALAALYRPLLPDRFMGELAARRARPWLTATSLVALALSGAVSVALLGPSVAAPRTVDLIGLALVGLQVVLMGRAIVSYEVFTGKPLPRGGLARHWRRSLVLAAGLGGIMALSLELAIDETLRLLLAHPDRDGVLRADDLAAAGRARAEPGSASAVRGSRQLSASLLDPVATGRDGGLARPRRGADRTVPRALRRTARGAGGHPVRRRSAVAADRAAALAPATRP